MRIIAAVRLSREDEASGMSPEAQREAIERFVQRNGHTVAHWAFDLGVSGEKPIRERPDVGQWLTDEHLPEWDAIVGSESSRLFRDLADSVMFYRDFASGHGKKVLTADGEIDMSTPRGEEHAYGEFLANQRELRKIKERNKRSADYYRARGWWHGGQVPFGYMPRKVNDGEGPHWILVPHPENAAIVREIAEGIITGMPVRAAARELTTRQVPTGRKSKGVPVTRWHANSLARMLRNPTLTGHIVREYKLAKTGQRESYALVRDSAGLPLRREPILDDATFARLQAALRRPEQKMGRVLGVAMLTGIARCGRRPEGGKMCGAPLWANTFTSRGKHYAYYLCSVECGARSIPQDDLHAELEKDLEQYFGYGNLERRLIPGSNHNDEIEGLEAQIRELDLDSEDYDADFARLRAQRAALKALPSEPDRVEWEPDGRTFGEVWRGLDTAGKRAKLIQAEYSPAFAYRDEQGRTHFIALKSPAGFIARAQAFGRPSAI